MTSDNEPRLIRPLLVVRTRRAVTSYKVLRELPQVIRQYTAVRDFADQSGGVFGDPIVIQRSDARYIPADDRRLISAIDEARENAEMLAIDDVFRLIDCRERDRANAGFMGLVKLKPPIYSIQHSKELLRMTWEFAHLQIADRRRQSLIRSQRVKDGLEKVREPGDGPTRKVIEKAVASKQRKADRRAAMLIIEIERIRVTLPADRRTDLKAIAAALDEANVPTSSGRGSWQGTMVKRVFDRVGKALDA